MSEATSFVPHPDYSTGSLENNIALIRLNNKVEVSTYTSFISLPRDVGNSFVDSQATIQGTGQTSDSNLLHFETRAVIPNEQVIL